MGQRPAQQDRADRERRRVAARCSKRRGQTRPIVAIPISAEAITSTSPRPDGESVVELGSVGLDHREPADREAPATTAAPSARRRNAAARSGKLDRIAVGGQEDGGHVGARGDGHQRRRGSRSRRSSSRSVARIAARGHLPGRDGADRAAEEERVTERTRARTSRRAPGPRRSSPPHRAGRTRRRGG